MRSQDLAIAEDQIESFAMKRMVEHKASSIKMFRWDVGNVNFGRQHCDIEEADSYPRVVLLVRKYHFMAAPGYRETDSAHPGIVASLEDGGCEAARCHAEIKDGGFYGK